VIVTRVDGGLRVVRQVDHQEQCGLIAAEWGSVEFTRPQPWDAVVTACAWHDEGWRAWEEAPGILANGCPRGFAEMDAREHVAIHRASAAAAVPRGERVAALVAMHGMGLVMGRLGLDGPIPSLAERPDPVRALVVDAAGSARSRRTGLGEGVDVAQWAWAAYRILQAIDLLSLYLTWRGCAAREKWTLPRVPRVPGDEAGIMIDVTPVDEVTCALDPWPFSRDRVDAPVASRIIDDLAYPDDHALLRALRAAPVRIAPMAVIPA
jgi:hypothetical protein